MKKRDYFIVVIFILAIILLSFNTDGICSIILSNKIEGVQSVLMVKFQGNGMAVEKLGRNEAEECLQGDNYYFQSSQRMRNSIGQNEYIHMPFDINGNINDFTSYAEVNKRIIEEQFEFSLLAGEYPNKPNEIVVTDYMLDTYVLKGEELSNSNAYNNIMGKLDGEFYLRSVYSKLLTLKVVGILKTNYKLNNIASKINSKMSVENSLRLKNFYGGKGFFDLLESVEKDERGQTFEMAPTAVIVCDPSIQQLKQSQGHNYVFLSTGVNLAFSNRISETSGVILWIISSAFVVYIFVLIAKLKRRKNGKR